VSKVIIFNGCFDDRLAFANRLMSRIRSAHRLVENWNGVDVVEADTVVLTDLQPPFQVPLDCLLVSVGPLIGELK
jgi:hypothetical protein